MRALLRGSFYLGIIVLLGLALTSCVSSGAKSDYVGSWEATTGGKKSVIELSDDGSASFSEVPISATSSASDQGKWRYSEVEDAVYLLGADGLRVTTVYLQNGPFGSKLKVFICDPDDVKCSVDYSRTR